MAILFNGAKQFGRELPKKNCCEIISRGLPNGSFCEIILKSVHRFSRRNRLKLFSIYSPGGHFVQRSGTV